MPYITKEDRTTTVRAFPHNAGTLNFAITSLCTEFIERRGKRYASINEVVGALECAKLEFYRRLAAPYEDKKIAENGDIIGYAEKPTAEAPAHV